MTHYTPPAVTVLGSFVQETGFALGPSFEAWLHMPEGA